MDIALILLAIYVTIEVFGGFVWYVFMHFIRWMAYYVDHRPDCDHRRACGPCNCGLPELKAWLKMQGVE